MRWSIRWRLTLWNLLALAAVLLGFAGVVYGMLSHALYEQADRTLLAALRQLDQDRRLPEDPGGRLRYWIDEFKEHENVLGVVYAPDGTVFARTTELAAESVPPPPNMTAAGPRLHDLDLPIVGRQRVLERRARLGDRDFAVLLMASLKEVDHELAELLAVLLTAGPLALALAGGLSYLLARKALAPVEQLRSQTQQVTADRLDRRVPVANPHDELGRLAETINAMIARLERSFAEVRRFTADASHELRTPLATIRTEAEVALRSPLTLADHQQLLGSILEECGRLTDLTDQLLALAREDVGLARPAREPLDLGALVGETAETMRPLADAKGVRLRATQDGAVPVYGDPIRLRQVFFNLLDNAIKYTPGGGQVEAGVGRRDRAAVAVVRDTGVGIPAEHLPHVFDRFYRVDMARSRAEGGTGLGLSIAKSVVEAHGGRIELASTPGRGTVCTVTFPLRASG
jgi:heavy metal sensor kinase